LTGVLRGAGRRRHQEENSMAQVPVRVSTTIVDEWGIEASTAFYASADDTQTVAALNTEVASWLTAMDAVTAGYLKDARVTILPAIPTAAKSAAASGSRVEQTGVLGFATTGNNKRSSFNVPAISNGATVMSGDRIVLTSIDPVGVLIAILTTVGTVLTWTNAHNQQITAFIDALVGFHKKRRQLQRSSFEV